MATEIFHVPQALHKFCYYPSDNGMYLISPCPWVGLFNFVWGPYPAVFRLTHVFMLEHHSCIRGPYVVLWIESISTLYKAIALFTIMSFWHLGQTFFTSLESRKWWWGGYMITEDGPERSQSNFYLPLRLATLLWGGSDLGRPGINFLVDFSTNADKFLANNWY